MSIHDESGDSDNSDDSNNSMLEQSPDDSPKPQEKIATLSEEDAILNQDSSSALMYWHDLEYQPESGGVVLVCRSDLDRDHWVTVVDAEPDDTSKVTEALESFGNIDVIYIRIRQKLIHVKFRNKSEATAASSAKITTSDDLSKELLVRAGKVTRMEISSQQSPTKTVVPELTHQPSPVPKRPNLSIGFDMFNHPNITVRKRYRHLLNTSNTNSTP